MIEVSLSTEELVLIRSDFIYFWGGLFLLMKLILALLVLGSSLGWISNLVRSWYWSSFRVYSFSLTTTYWAEVKNKFT